MYKTRVGPLTEDLDGLLGSQLLNFRRFLGYQLKLQLILNRSANFADLRSQLSVDKRAISHWQEGLDRGSEITVIIKISGDLSAIS